jgi:hypothetical protein
MSHRPIGVRLAALLAAATSAAVLAVPANADEPAPLNGGQAASTQPVIVRVPLRTELSPSNFGMSGIVEMRVGRSAPVRVLLDTGSTGLRLFPGALDRVRGGVRVTKRTVSTPAHGGRLHGVIASALMEIGGVPTVRPVEFQVTKNTSPYVQGWEQRGVYGILGIGTGSTPLPNPLRALPGSVGLHWSVHFGGEPRAGVPGGGALVLGAPVSTDAVATFSMPSDGADGYGALLWDDHKANGCWQVDRGPLSCMNTWFDSLSDQLTLAGPDFARLRTDANGVVSAGVRVRMSVAGSAFSVWTVVTGSTPSYNLTVASPKSPRLVNTGNNAFYDFTVTYDMERGLVSLSAPRG